MNIFMNLLKCGKSGKSSVRLLKKVLLVLVVAVLLVGAGLVATSLWNDGFSKVLDEYKSDYPDGLLVVQTLSGDSANNTLIQLQIYCPDLSLGEYYLLEIRSDSQKKSVISVIDPASGKIDCRIERSIGLGGSNSLVPNLLATVNGEPVLTEDVLKIYNAVPESLRTDQSLQQSFEQVVNNKLLLQEAKAEGFSVSSDEVDSAVDAFLTRSGLTLPVLEESLASVNSSMASFRDGLKEDLLLQKMVMRVLEGSEEVSATEVEEYYSTFKENLTTIPRSSTRQILIYANQSTAAAKLEYVKGIASQINESNFCELASLYSEDSVTKDSCGGYEAAAGQLLPEYEQVVYASKPGDIKLISTRMGYHIVHVVGLEPARLLSLEEAMDGIRDFLSLQKRQALLTSHLQILREDAKIVSYMQAPNQTSN
ncbi:peptidylprolyl isomerase [Candidatus Woesearchaeota archaeon]|nr:peptidylprolyl isomerase [Candidatus Woesearchaeota archaeon]